MPVTIHKLLDFIANSPIAEAAGLSVLVAVLRVAYDDRETTWTRILLEGLICGALTVMAGMAAKAMGLSDAWAFLFGGTLAFMGVSLFRKTMLELVKARWGKKDDDQV